MTFRQAIIQAIEELREHFGADEDMTDEVIKSADECMPTQAAKCAVAVVPSHLERELIDVLKQEIVSGDGTLVMKFWEKHKLAKI